MKKKQYSSMGDDYFSSDDDNYDATGGQEDGAEESVSEYGEFSARFDDEEEGSGELKLDDSERSALSNDPEMQKSTSSMGSIQSENNSMRRRRTSRRESGRTRSHQSPSSIRHRRLERKSRASSPGALSQDGTASTTNSKSRRPASSSPHGLRRRVAKPVRRRSGGALGNARNSAAGEERAGVGRRATQPRRRRSHSPGSLSLLYNEDQNSQGQNSRGQPTASKEVRDSDSDVDEGDVSANDGAIVNEELDDLQQMIQAAKGVSVS